MSIDGREIPLLLRFLCYKPITFEKMKTLVLIFFIITGTVDEEDNNDEEDEVTVDMVTYSQPLSQKQIVCYTDSEND